MKDEHSREDELLIQMIGLEGKIDNLKKEKQELIPKFLEDLKWLNPDDDQYHHREIIIANINKAIVKWEGILND